MKLYSENEFYKLYQGNMLDMLEVIEKESIDSIVTDPPYELNFMSKGWDNAGVSFQPDTWRKCFEVLKPGGYLLAFGGSRTFHRIACAIEDAGFEIRDTIMWLYGSGFPKSMNVGLAIDKKNGVESKIIGEGKSGVSSRAYQSEELTTAGKYDLKEAQNEWKGWGTALKPSFEPIIVARKPFKGSLVDNVIEYGVGGINIDECRVESNGEKIAVAKDFQDINYSSQFGNENFRFKQANTELKELGRFPANTILTYDETDYDEVCGGFPDTKSGSKMSFGSVRKKQPDNCYKLGFTQKDFNDGQNAPDNYGDSGSASRYFYCAKASKKDRDEGLEEFETKSQAEINNRKEGSAGVTRQYGGGTNPFLSVSCPRKNTHPTVKPTSLMQYLVRLVSPDGATILDPFNGSGSTGKAVMYENKERNKDYKYIGIELTEEYLPIAKARIEHVCNLEEEKDNQTDIFEFLGE